MVYHIFVQISSYTSRCHTFVAGETPTPGGCLVSESSALTARVSPSLAAALSFSASSSAYKRYDQNAMLQLCCKCMTMRQSFPFYCFLCCHVFGSALLMSAYKGETGLPDSCPHGAALGCTSCVPSWKWYLQDTISDMRSEIAFVAGTGCSFERLIYTGR